MRDEYIREEIRSCGGNLSMVARRLDLDYGDLKARFGDDISLQPIVRPSGPIPDDIATLCGVNGWERYVIAIKKNNDAWPPQFTQAIHEARRKFDAGTHWMFQQKRADGWIVQYLVPRRFPLRRPRPYFARVWGH